MSQAKTLRLERTFDAPREIVWMAWTDPHRLREWWGPQGFTAPDSIIDLRVGGRFIHCMRGPDGKEYWSTGVFREIVPYERLVMTDSFSDEKGNVVPASHYGLEADYPLELEITVTFEDLGGKTLMTLEHTGLPQAGGGGESQGWNESFDKLSARLEEDTRDIIVTRTIEASRERVFEDWTTAERLGAWWGPDGFTTTTKRFEFRPGGTWDFVMHGPDGTDYPNLIRFTTVEAPSRIEYEHGSSEIHEGGFRSTATFEEVDGRTTVTLRMRFPTREARDETVKFGAVEGGRQTLGRLAALVEGTSEATT